MLGIFLDTETNGLNFDQNHPLEIAFKILDLYSGEEKQSYQTLITQSKDVWDKSNLKSLEINGFTYDQISQGKPQNIVANEILQIFKKHAITEKSAVFICQNPSFDRVFFSKIINCDIQNLLNWPYHWLDLASMYWALSMKNQKENNSYFPWEKGFSKNKIALAYNLPAEQLPHRAMNGVDHLILCYRKIVGFAFA